MSRAVNFDWVANMQITNSFLRLAAVKTFSWPRMITTRIIHLKINIAVLLTSNIKIFSQYVQLNY